jgi:hypothetical protein
MSRPYQPATNNASVLATDQRTMDHASRLASPQILAITIVTAELTSKAGIAERHVARGDDLAVPGVLRRRVWTQSVRRGTRLVGEHG